MSYNGEAYATAAFPSFRLHEAGIGPTSTPHGSHSVILRAKAKGSILPGTSNVVLNTTRLIMIQDDRKYANLPLRSLHAVSVELREKIDAFLAEELEAPLLRNVQAQLRVSIGVVEEALSKYRPEEISISYNGGKDCLVLLIVIIACLTRRSSKTPSTVNLPAKPITSSGKFQAVYIVSPHPFPEVDSFVASSSEQYHLEVAHYVSPMKKGLESYLADHPSIRAIFVGTRRTDPHGEKLSHFDPTDAGWPDFMRVHPVIDWHYTEIWAFIRHMGVPYCPLYDQGYTSLGGTQDTYPNPLLKKEGENEEGFRPAYELLEDDEERLGRDR